MSSSTLTSTRAPNSGFGAGASAAASGSGGLTIAQLLEDVNEVIPLETHVEDGIGDAGQWGLEDYAVEVMGFECLHFMEVDGLLRDGDEVVYVYPLVKFFLYIFFFVSFIWLMIY